MTPEDQKDLNILQTIAQRDYEINCDIITMKVRDKLEVCLILHTGTGGGTWYILENRNVPTTIHNLLVNYVDSLKEVCDKLTEKESTASETNGGLKKIIFADSDRRTILADMCRYLPKHELSRIEDVIDMKAVEYILNATHIGRETFGIGVESRPKDTLKPYYVAMTNTSSHIRWAAGCGDTFAHFGSIEGVFKYAADILSTLDKSDAKI